MSITSIMHFFSMARRNAEHIAKKEDIKNYDRDGPEGQSKATGSTMCNAGQSPWYPCFLIQGYPIKVSMRKKRRERVKREVRSARIYRPVQMVCARLRVRSALQTHARDLLAQLLTLTLVRASFWTFRSLSYRCAPPPPWPQVPSCCDQNCLSGGRFWRY